MQIYLSTWGFKREIDHGEKKFVDFPKLAVDNGFAGIEIMDRQLLGYPSEDLAVLCERAQELNCGLIRKTSCIARRPIGQLSKIFTKDTEKISTEEKASGEFSIRKAAYE